MKNREYVVQLLDLNNVIYTRGVGEVNIDYKTMKQLQKEKLLDLEASYADGPTISQVIEFMDKYNKRGVELRLLVIDPKREDFRVCVKAVSIPTGQARVNTMEDMKFWKDFMDFGKLGEGAMVEDELQISWVWNK